MAYEQRRLEKFFERLDMGADRGSGDVERAGRVREAQMSGHGFEGSQRIERQFGMLNHLGHYSVYLEALPADSTLQRQNIWDGLTEQAPHVTGFGFE